MSALGVDSDCSQSSSGYEDGLGRRVLAFDREAGVMLERLSLRPELCAFEKALNARLEVIAGLEDERFAKPRAIEHLFDGRLIVVSEFIGGRRLSDIIDSAAEHGIVAGLDAGLGVLLELLPAIARLHDAGLCHGAIAPGRIMITRDGQILLLDAIYAEPLERLQLTRKRLWSELRLAFPPTAGLARFDKAADLSHAVMVTAALIVGRPLTDDEYPEGIPALRQEISEIASIRGSKSFADAIDAFFAAALPLPGKKPARAATSADEAAIDLRKLLRKELGINTCRTALVEFLQQVDAADAERTAAETSARAKKESERLAQAQAQAEAERRARDKADAERKAREEAERRAREEAERQAREEAERRAREEAERKAREEAERKAREEAERKAREEAERKAREEAERKAREEAERKAREEAERKAREEAERKAREEAARKAREEAERKAREEAERKAREEAERKAREEAARKAREEAERKAREEAERKAREEAERKAREEAERKAREKAEAEQRERERLAREARERAEKARLEAERLERERVEAERQERERLEQIARERAERERREAERLEREAREREAEEARARAEQERLERDRVARERAERAERERQEQLEKARLEKARLDKERRDKERLERERSEKERIERERIENERAAAASAAPRAGGWLVSPEKSAAFEPAVPVEPHAAQSERPYPIYVPPSEPGGWTPAPPPDPAKIEVAPMAGATTSSAVTAPAPKGGPIRLKLRDDPPAPVHTRAEFRNEPEVRVTAAESYTSPEWREEKRQIPWKLIAAGVLVLVAGAYAIFQYASPKAEPVVETVKKVVPNSAPPPPATPPAGEIAVRSEPAGLKVLLDGKAAGESPVTLKNVPTGKHVITLVGDGGTLKRTVRVEPGAGAVVDVPVFSGFVKITVPFVIEIAENGKVLGTSDDAVLLGPGRHFLHLSNKDLNYTAIEQVEVQPGETTQLNLDPRGRANINAAPWAEVWIDGDKAGETPLANVPIRLGLREIVLKNPQFPDRKIVITIKSGTPETIAVDFNKDK